MKIVFFGQSITRQNYARKIIETKLRQKYPYAQLEVLNTAIGGYGASKSVRTMFHTLIPHQPDLIVFHLYGGEKDGTYDEILKNFRKYTTAEVVTITHHLDIYNDQIIQEREEGSQLRRDLAKKYGFELVEVRENWKKYLSAHNMEIKDMLNDNIHHNKKGGELWGALQARYFEEQPVSPSSWQSRITSIKPLVSDRGLLGIIQYEPKHWMKTDRGIKTSNKGASLFIEFEGTRVDVISKFGNGKAHIFLDGKKVSEIGSTWSATLPSSTKIDYRPALRKANIIGKPVDEKLTLTAHNISPDGKEYSFSLKGSISGEQGRGDHTKKFYSKNGVWEIDPKDITFSHAVQIKKKPVPFPLEVSWETYNNSLETWTCEGATPSNLSGQVTLVQQLENKKHILEIVPIEGSISIDEILLYKPEGK